MKHTMFLIESLMRSKGSVSKLYQTSITSKFHSISRPPFSQNSPTRTYSPFSTKAGDPSPIHPNPFPALTRNQAQPNFTKQRLWNLLRWSSPIPLILCVFWYMDKLDTTNETENNGKGITMRDEMKRPNQFIASAGLHTYELSHYMFYLSMFYVFTCSKKQPPKFGPALAFWFILISFIGILFSHVSSNLSNYGALNAKAPFFYQVSGTWSNHEGSILLWCLILSFYIFLFRRPYGKFY